SASSSANAVWLWSGSSHQRCGITSGSITVRSRRGCPACPRSIPWTSLLVTSRKGEGTICSGTCTPQRCQASSSALASSASTATYTALTSSLIDSAYFSVSATAGLTERRPVGRGRGPDDHRAAGGDGAVRPDPGAGGALPPAGPDPVARPAAGRDPPAASISRRGPSRTQAPT